MVQTINTWQIGDGGLYKDEPAVIIGVTEDNKLEIIVFNKDFSTKHIVECTDFIVKVRFKQEPSIAYEYTKDN